MPSTIAGQFSPRFTRWLTTEGFQVNEDGTSACAVIVDPSRTTWGLSVRAVSPTLWTLVVVFDPAGDHEEIFYDLDGDATVITQMLARQLTEVRDDSPLV